MQVTANGLVIREKVLSNDNRLLTILTAEQGLVRAFVKSVKKLGGSVSAATDLFAYSSFVLFHNKDQYSINSAEPLRMFYHLRDDLEKTSLAAYLAELAGELVPEGEPAQEQLSLFLNCLYLLEQNKRPAALIKPVFELRLMTMSGYMPDLVGCQNCGEYQADAFFFFPSTGALLCNRCSHQIDPQGAVLLTQAQLAAMRHIIYSEPNRVFQFKMSEAGLNNLGKITEHYLLTQLDRQFPSLDFYHSLYSFELTMPTGQAEPKPETERM